MSTPLIGVKLPGSESDHAAQLAQWDNLVGRPADFTNVYGSDGAWTTASGAFIAASYHLSKMKTTRPVLWGIPLCLRQGDLTETLAGTRNKEFTTAAQQILAGSPVGPIYIRLGYELNGDSFGWCYQKNRPSKFVDAFNLVYDLFIRVSTRFVPVWNILLGKGTRHALLAAWPGSHAKISCDLYFYPQWQDPNAAKAFDHILNHPIGLQWLYDFAGSNLGVDELGVSAGGTPFLEAFHTWAADKSLSWISYWHSNSNYSGSLLNDPRLLLAWFKLFGGHATFQSQLNEVTKAHEVLLTENRNLKDQYAAATTELQRLSVDAQKYVAIREAFKQLLT